MTAAACTGQLGLAILAAARGAKSPVALPLAGLCLCLFGWNFMALAHDLSGDPLWRIIDVAISPFTTPLAVHFALVFVGERRRFRRVLWLAYGAFGALSLASLAALVSEAARGFAGSEAWAYVHLALTAPGVGFALYLLLGHLRRSSDDERRRTQLVLAALFVGAAFASTELLSDVGVPVLRLGALATFVSTALLALVSLRFRLLDDRPTWVAGLAALSIGMVAVLGYLIVFRFLGASEALLVLGTVTVTLALVVAIRPIVIGVAVERARRQRLTVVGRMSAQMAHDLKTPLAALKGAAQFLEEERARGRSIDDQTEFLAVLVEEADRASRLVDKYRRLATFELARSEVDVKELVDSVVASTSAVARAASVDVQTEVPVGLPPCDLDRDLVTVALENLVSNAIEAMPEGGTVTVAVTPMDRRGEVRVIVRDTGSGMDAREQEQAFEEFHTTKAKGTGLGLPFVKRVVEAHGGRVTLASEPGKGTEVRLVVGGG
jgi:signal transduction histidine kinase